MLSSPNKKFVLSGSFLNFSRTFRKLKEQFLRGWKNSDPLLGIRPSFIATGQGIRAKENARVAGIRSLKKFSPGVARGDVLSWN